MASAPFTIAETTPEDDDIVSLYPGVERTFRDAVESWLLINHNIQGRHDELALDWEASPSGIASVTQLWGATTTGDLMYRVGAGNVSFLIPPGTIVDYAGTTAPEGWLLTYGQAISRTTYASLFTAIGTTYGVGDGATTFNLPDIRGRVVAGQDDMGGSSANRLVDAGSTSLNGDTLGDTGGAESFTLLKGQVPSLDVADTRTYQFSHRDTTDSGPRGDGADAVADDTNVTVTINMAAPASGTLVVGDTTPDVIVTVQPTIILNKIIKF